jgi:undecaprenyl diphosphate synthase
MTTSPAIAADVYPDVPRGKMPKHIAIIMDGNGRWARHRGQPRAEGHRRGAMSVRCITEECTRLGIEQLTLYCLSSENWKRPPEELKFLLELLQAYLIDERPRIMANNIRLSWIGRREGMPEDVLQTFDESIRLSANNTGLRLCLAINYGGRAEMVDAVRCIAEKACQGEIDPATIDEGTIDAHLYTKGMPEPDLLIRTAGEMRVSNFLLWQISYAEIWVTDIFWPDFTEAHLHAAIQDYAGRDRRFGGLNS